MVAGLAGGGVKFIEGIWVEIWGLLEQPLHSAEGPTRSMRLTGNVQEPAMQRFCSGGWRGSGQVVQRYLDVVTAVSGSGICQPMGAETRPRYGDGGEAHLWEQRGRIMKGNW